jgi:hypothetical protein
VLTWGQRSPSHRLPSGRFCLREAGSGSGTKGHIPATLTTCHNTLRISKISRPRYGSGKCTLRSSHPPKSPEAMGVHATGCLDSLTIAPFQDSSLGAITLPEIIVVPTLRALDRATLADHVAGNFRQGGYLRRGKALASSPSDAGAHVSRIRRSLRVGVGIDYVALNSVASLRALASALRQSTNCCHENGLVSMQCATWDGGRKSGWSAVMKANGMPRAERRSAAG